MKCLTCKKEIIYKLYANNKKYCSLSCRNKAYQPRVTARQLARYDRRASEPDPNKIQCFICKKWYRKVGSHIKERHDMTCRQYREYFDLEVKRGLLTESERKPLRDNVFSNGTVKNLKKGKRFWFVKGDKKAENIKEAI